jgi:hypothetical protein
MALRLSAGRQAVGKVDERCAGNTSSVPTSDEWRRGFAEPDPYEEPRPMTPPPQPGGVGFEGAGDHGVIKVIVDGSGAVADVVIPSNWRDHIAPRELGDALRAAANNAFFSRLADELGNADLEQQPAPAPPPAAGGNPPGPVSASLESEVDDLIAQFDRDLRIYRDRLRTAADTATATGRGSNGRIEVTMRSALVSEITVDPKWARSARYTEVRAEALAALQAACRQAGARGPASVPLPASLARIQELASDPRALSRQLGLS